MEKYDLNPILHQEKPFWAEAELTDITDRLVKKEPIQYILGYTYFCGLKIAVSPDVLIPRPETEELVSLAKSLLTSEIKTIADICTGSGCIAMAMQAVAKERTIIATDVSEKALKMAADNEWANFKNKRILFKKHDILTKTWEFETPGMVICNPPYIEKKEGKDMEEHVLQYEPHLALFVEDGNALLFYEAVIQAFINATFPIILFEINPLFSKELLAYCKNCGLTCDIRNDMQGKERFAIISRQ